VRFVLLHLAIVTSLHLLSHRADLELFAMHGTSEAREEIALPEKIKSNGDDGHTDVAVTRKPTGLTRAIVVMAVISSTFFYALDNTIMANIRPGIIKSLGHIEMLPWMTVAYPMGEVGSCPFW
jgi:hypothetical protein